MVDRDGKQVLLCTWSRRSADLDFDFAFLDNPPKKENQQVRKSNCCYLLQFFFSYHFQPASATFLVFKKKTFHRLNKFCYFLFSYSALQRYRSRDETATTTYTIVPSERQSWICLLLTVDTYSCFNIIIFLYRQEEEENGFRKSFTKDLPDYTKPVRPPRFSKNRPSVPKVNLWCKPDQYFFLFLIAPSGAYGCRTWSVKHWFNCGRGEVSCIPHTFILLYLDLL